MEKDKKIHNTLLTIIGVMTLLVAVIGATFAYFSATYTAKPQNIKTGELKVSASSSIDHNENIKPTKWNGDDVSEIDETNENDITVVTLTVDTAGTTIDEAHYNIFLSATGIKLNETQVQVSQSGEKANRTGGTLSEIKWSFW